MTTPNTHIYISNHSIHTLFYQLIKHVAKLKKFTFPFWLPLQPSLLPSWPPCPPSFRLFCFYLFPCLFPFLSPFLYPSPRPSPYRLRHYLSHYLSPYRRPQLNLPLPYDDPPESFQPLYRAPGLLPLFYDPPALFPHPYDPPALLLLQPQVFW